MRRSRLRVGNRLLPALLGVGGLLLVALSVLKLAGYITWSWWWVLCPLWLPLAVLAVFVVFALLGYFVFVRGSTNPFR